MGTLDAWKGLVRSLAPPSDSFRPDDGPVYRGVLGAMARVLRNTEAALEPVFDETIPWKADTLLPEWARLYSLPGDCYEPTTDPNEIRAQLATRVPRWMKANKAAFIALGVSLGYGVAITSPVPLRAGLARCGQTLVSNGSAGYVWNVTTTAVPGSQARCGLARCGQPIFVWGTERMIECVFQNLIQSHRLLKFEHIGV